MVAHGRSFIGMMLSFLFLALSFDSDSTVKNESKEAHLCFYPSLQILPAQRA